MFICKNSTACAATAKRISAADASCSAISAKRRIATVGTATSAKTHPNVLTGASWCKKRLSGIYRTGQTASMHLLIGLLRGSTKEDILEKGYDKLKTYGVGKELNSKAWKEYLYQNASTGIHRNRLHHQWKLKGNRLRTQSPLWRTNKPS